MRPAVAIDAVSPIVRLPVPAAPSKYWGRPVGREPIQHRSPTHLVRASGAGDWPIIKEPLFVVVFAGSTTPKLIVPAF